MPSKENVFRNLYLNQRVDAEAAWITSADYDQCVGEIPDLTGRSCYGGLDLSSSQDLTALVLCFPPQTDEEAFYILPYAWVPSEAIKRRSQIDRMDYGLWQKQGFIEALAGSVIDYRPILQKISDLAQKYDIRGICFDRWGAVRVISDLEEAGLEVIMFGQGFASMSPPIKELEKMIKLLVVNMSSKLNGKTYHLINVQLLHLH